MDSNRLSSVFLGFLSVLAAGAVLHLTAGVVVPLVAAVLFAFVLSPAVEFLTRRVKIPRAAAILIVILLVMGFIFLIGLFFYSSLIVLYRQVPKYTGKFILIIEHSLDRFNLPVDVLSQIPWARTVSSSLFAFTRQFMDFLSALVLMVLFLVFLLLERPQIRPKMVDAFQRDTTKRISRIYAHIAEQIGKFLSGKLLISSVTGFFVWFVFWILGIDFAFVWGVLTFFFNFIPSIGSIIITIVTGLFAVLQFYPSWNEPVIAIILMTIFQQVMGNLVEPRLLGDMLNLSPVVIIFSLLVWGWIWGVVGMFIAVPMTVAVKIVCENIPFLKPVAILMGTGRIRHHRQPETKEEAPAL